VLTHGFTLDGDGKAMSKSAGNAMSPEEIVSKFGADVLRLWVASADYRDDMRLSPDILKQAADAYRRLRNTFRFLLINVGDFDPKRDMVERDKMRALDRHMLDRLANLAQRVIRAYDEYEYHKVFHLLHQLCAVDLSSLYLDAIKDRLYCERRDDTARRAAQTVAWHCLDTLLRLIAPIIPFTSDEAWRHRPALDGDSSSVHLADFPTVPEPWSDSALAENWRRILEVRGEVTKAIEEKRAAGSIGKSLEAKVTVSADAATRDALGTLPAEELAELFIVSAVEVAQGGALNVTVSPADGEKCARCWRVQATTGESAKFPGTCRRCSDVLESLT
jgi:isoleucyl-tRNA synthetase